MRTFAVAFLLSLSVALLLTPLVRRMALRLGALDPGGGVRKVHTAETPRLGGLAIVLAFYAPLLGLFIYRNDVSRMFLAEPGHAAGLIGGGVTIAALGVYDDLRGAGALVKLSVQTAVALALFALGFRFEGLSTPFGTLELSWLSLPLTVLWIVGITNAMNLIDGLDGLASGVAFLAVFTMFVLSAQRHQLLMMLIFAALGGALAGFLFFNFNPALIFMGDTGSMFLGFVLGVTAIPSSQKSATLLAVGVPVLALGLPIFDTLLAVIRRTLRGRPLFSADREHIHHQLLALGLTHRRAVLILYGVSAVLCTVGLAMTWAAAWVNAVLLAGVGVGSALLLRWLYAQRAAAQAQLEGAAGSRSEVRRANLARRRAADGLVDGLGRARERQALAAFVAEVGTRLELQSVRIDLVAADPSVAPPDGGWAWTRAGGDDGAPPTGAALAFAIRVRRERVGELRCTLPTVSVDHDLALVLERLAGAVADLLAHTAPTAAAAPPSRAAVAAPHAAPVAPTVAAPHAAPVAPPVAPASATGPTAAAPPVAPAAAAGPPTAAPAGEPRA